MSSSYIRRACALKRERFGGLLGKLAAAGYRPPCKGALSSTARVHQAPQGCSMRAGKAGNLSLWLARRRRRRRLEIAPAVYVWPCRAAHKTCKSRAKAIKSSSARRGSNDVTIGAHKIKRRGARISRGDARGELSRAPGIQLLWEQKRVNKELKVIACMSMSALLSGEVIGDGGGGRAGRYAAGSALHAAGESRREENLHISTIRETEKSAR